MDVLVIGAGFAGLYALHRLRGLGFSVRVLEAADGVGGTWYWNRYPGARCDSESYYYCYSFDPELEQEWRWSERYPGQEEIRAYLEHVADRYDLRRDIELGVRVASAVREDDDWVVTDTQGRERRCRWLVTAVGCLSVANVPDLPRRQRARQAAGLPALRRRDGPLPAAVRRRGGGRLPRVRAVPAGGRVGMIMSTWGIRAGARVCAVCPSPTIGRME